MSKELMVAKPLEIEISASDMPVQRVAVSHGKGETPPETAGKLYNRELNLAQKEMAIVFIREQAVRDCPENKKWDASVKTKYICRSKDGINPDLSLFSPDNPQYDENFPEPVSPKCQELTPTGYEPVCPRADWNDGRPHCIEGKNLYGLDMESGFLVELYIKGQSMAVKHSIKDENLTWSQYAQHCLAKGQRTYAKYATKVTVNTAVSKTGNSSFVARFSPPVELTDEQFTQILPTLEMFANRIIAGNMFQSLF